MVQLIETSLVSAHFVDSSNTVYLDVCSCTWYAVDVGVEFARTRFTGGRVHVQQYLRRYADRRGLARRGIAPGHLVHRSRKGVR